MMANMAKITVDHLENEATDNTDQVETNPDAGEEGLQIEGLELELPDFQEAL